MFKCNKCVHAFNRKDSLTRHTKIHEGVRFTCTVCTLIFTVKSNLMRHRKNVHGMFILNSIELNYYINIFYEFTLQVFI